MTKVILAGGSGFIGTHIANRIRDEHEVTVVDIKRPKAAGVRFLRHDLMHPIKFDDTFDACIHLAAIVGGIQYFSTHPAENAYRNSLIHSNIFEACAKSGVRKVIYASSSVVYQFAKHFPTPEEETMRVPPPSSSYGITKLLGEYFCRSYEEEYGIKYTILRPFNAYGPGEDPDIDYAHAIPQLVAKVLAGQYPVRIFGDGKQTRCFTYCQDIAEAFARCIRDVRSDNQILNISSDEEIRILDLLERIWRICGETRPLRVRRLPPFLQDVRRRRPSINRAKKTLSWEPRTRLDDGLPVTIKWLQSKPRLLESYMK